MIANFDWDFSALFAYGKEPEATACWCYESAREFELRTFPKRKRKAILAYWEHELESLPASSSIYAKMVLDLARAGLFPNTAWLSLQVETRKAKLAELAFPSLLIPPASLRNFLSWIGNSEINEPDQPWMTLYGEGETLAAIRLDWSRTDNELKEDFEILLRRLQPSERKSGKKKGSGRRSSRFDMLKRLAARRLVRDCGSADLACEKFGEENNPIRWMRAKGTNNNRGQDVYSWERLCSQELFLPTSDDPYWPETWFGHSFLKSSAVTFLANGRVGATNPPGPLRKNRF